MARWLLILLVLGNALPLAIPEEAIPRRHDPPFDLDDFQKNPLFPFRSDSGGWGYLDLSGRVVVPAAFTLAKQFSEGLAAVSSLDSHGMFYVDTRGKRLSAASFECAEPFSEGYARVGTVTKDGVRYGYVDRTGVLRIDFQFPSAGPFSEGLAAAKDARGLFGYIDMKGAFTIPARYLWAQKFSCGRALVWPDGPGSGTHKVFIDRTGATVITIGSREVGWFSGGLALYEDETSHRFGYLDTAGKTVIKPVYKYAYPFSEGLARVVRVDGATAYITQSGEQAFESLAPYSEEFHDGLARAYSGGVSGKWGFIDRIGQWAIGPQFAKATDFVRGLALVETERGIGYINREGDYVWWRLSTGRQEKKPR